MSRSKHNSDRRVYKKDTKDESRSKGRAQERDYLHKVKKDVEHADEDMDPEYDKASNPWNWD